MKIAQKQFTFVTSHETELINITDNVKEFVVTSGVKNGFVLIMSKHTTTAIIVNEGLPDIGFDIVTQIERLIPNDMPYYHHARFLHSDGQMAINTPSHIRWSLLGFEVIFPVKNNQILAGKRQSIYFVELDGPQERTYVLQAMGE
jgi:secondary thiamine-phosphate synthase enzyme